ncbi:MAG: DNA starvation/stationary phase protection protein [Acidimicrobiales bacterium]|nr:DNA starvation/stationary phase protection protein [Acidimicrobiales bacterium]
MTSSTASKPTRSPLVPAVQDRVGTVLQPILVDLIELSQIAKQAHWTVTGRAFRSVHLQLDEVVDTARTSTDQVAERLAIVGVIPDGRSSTVASSTEVPSITSEWLSTEAAVAAAADAVQAVAARTRTAITDLDGGDPITEDLLISITTQLEEHLWMLSAQEE